MKALKTLSIILTLATVFQLNAQDNGNDVHDMSISVPTVAIVDLESTNGTTINLGADVPTEAGQPVGFSTQTNTGIWLNYSSVKSTSKNPTRDIDVALTSGPLPNGLDLKVQASPYSGNGDGAMGTPAAMVSLSNSPQTIVSGIGSCYTGDGVNNGHNLTYTLNLASGSGAYAALDADNSSNIQITYTITDH